MDIDKNPSKKNVSILQQKMLRKIYKKNNFCFLLINQLFRFKYQ